MEQEIIKKQVYEIMNKHFSNCYDGEQEGIWYRKNESGLNSNIISQKEKINYALEIQFNLITNRIRNFGNWLSIQSPLQYRKTIKMFDKLLGMDEDVIK